MPAVPDPALILSALHEGEIHLQGQFVWGSNSTFLVNVVTSDLTFPAIYKPVRGERPLYDFPAASLSHREVAAFFVSEALGWKLVPPTIYRRKAPYGKGSLQLFIPHDAQKHYFNFSEEEKLRLKVVACFDLLVNNADRKGSHILLDEDNHLWAIDHGICFHRDYKLRTVIWDFIDQQIPGDLLASIAAFLPALAESGSGFNLLREWLLPVEIKAMRRRGEALLAERVFPPPQGKDRPFPYPPI